MFTASKIQRLFFQSYQFYPDRALADRIRQSALVCLRHTCGIVFCGGYRTLPGS